MWFLLDAQERVFACDRWADQAGNMRAIALSIEAMRGLDRWGVAGAVTRAFAGFTALPPGTSALTEAEPWRVVFGVAGLAIAPADLRAVVRARHRELIKACHPDAGGDGATAARLNAALDRAEAELAEEIAGPAPARPR